MSDSVPLAERLVFEQTFDGFLRKGLGDRVTPELQQRLAALGIDLDGKLKPAYPFEIWRLTLRAVAEVLHPGEPLEEAFEALGGDVVRGFFKHPLGSAMLAMLKLIGPRRTLDRAQRNLRNGNNYAQTRFTALDDRRFELWVNEASETRHNMTGILRTALELAGAKDPVVKIRTFDAESVTFDITWN